MYNVVKLWNMDDLSAPFTKFRNTCASTHPVVISILGVLMLCSP